MVRDNQEEGWFGCMCVLTSRASTHTYIRVGMFCELRHTAQRLVYLYWPPKLLSYLGGWYIHTYHMCLGGYEHHWVWFDMAWERVLVFYAVYMSGVSLVAPWSLAACARED